MNTNLHKAFVWICVIMTLYMLLLNVVLKSDTKIAFDDIDTRIDASRIDAITDSAEVVTPIGTYFTSNCLYIYYYYYYYQI